MGWEKPKKRKSPVWESFLVNKDVPDSVKCVKCEKLMSSKCSTSTLKGHITSCAINDSTAQGSSSQPEVTCAVLGGRIIKDASGSEMVLARLVAVANFPMYKLRTSKDVKEDILKKHNIPVESVSMRKMFMDTGEKLRTQIRSNLASRLSRDEQFSLR